MGVNKLVIMSDEKYGENPAYPHIEYDEMDDPVSYGKVTNEQNYNNPKYQRLIQDFMRCTTTYFDNYVYAQYLEKQLDRLDLDTVCAYELYQMKKEFTQSNCLNLSEFTKKH